MSRSLVFNVSLRNLQRQGQTANSRPALFTSLIKASHPAYPKVTSDPRQARLMTSNSAAWLTAAKTKPFEVKSAPLWAPGEHEILVKNHAVAVNPIDFSLQNFAWFPLEYPAILGYDVAGEVAAVGSSVTRFKQGDRVLGNTAGMLTKQKSESGFQEYTVLQTNMACEIPDSMAYENAAVIPLGHSTAAAALFQDNCLKLQLPTVPAQKPTGKTLLIWGGASSVGSNAIQLAVAAGYEVITTASPKNFEYVKKLGASGVFDYNKPTVSHDLVNFFKGKTSAGAFDCIGGSACNTCADVMQKSTGAKFVSSTKSPPPDVPEDITVKHVFATTIKDNHVGKAVYEDFLPKALKNESFVAAPEPLIAGEGLGNLQRAVDLLGKGVSAKKVVVTL